MGAGAGAVATADAAEADAAGPAMLMDHASRTLDRIRPVVPALDALARMVGNGGATAASFAVVDDSSPLLRPLVPALRALLAPEGATFPVAVAAQAAAAARGDPRWLALAASAVLQTMTHTLALTDSAEAAVRAVQRAFGMLQPLAAAAAAAGLATTNSAAAPPGSSFSLFGSARPVGVLALVALHPIVASACDALAPLVAAQQRSSLWTSSDVPAAIRAGAERCAWEKRWDCGGGSCD